MPRPRAKALGLLPPTTKPNFEIVRKPWLELNVVGDDPIRATSTAQDILYHYRSWGNNYAKQAWHADMRWEADDYFAFKCYVKPAAVEGRILLYSAKGSLQSGGIFVDSVDGRVGVGWYDTVQKREVSIRTNVPVLRVGKWHYIYVRKKFPVASLGSGCWEDSIFSLTPTSARDMIVVRELNTAAPSYLVRPWAAKALGRATLGGTFGETRECISFTTDLEYSIAGCDATGLVTPHTTTWTGAVGGLITASTSCLPESGTGKLHAYCLFQWSTANSKSLDGNVYRIDNLVKSSAAAANCGNTTAATPVPDFSTYTVGSTGGVFMGVRLVKSIGFDTAESPDQGVYDIEAFGSHLSEQPESGIMPFVGEYSSFAWVVESEAAGANPDIFESGAGPSDDIYIGTDGFVSELYGGTPWAGELAADTPRVFTAVDTVDYAYVDQENTTEPNEALEFELDPDSNANARAPTWETIAPSVLLPGVYSLGVAFYDPEQADISPPSNPGPELIVEIGQDDSTNPSGFTGITLQNIPVSSDDGAIQRWVYMSLPGKGQRFLVATIPDNTSTSITISKGGDSIADGALLQEDNGPPPRCKFVSASQGALAYGAILGFKDLVVFSKPFFIAAVPYGRSIFQVPSGASEEITGIANNNGKLIVFKRDAVWRAQLVSGLVIYAELAKEMGCVGHGTIFDLQNRLYWVGEQGLYVYNGAGMPYWIGAKVESLFNDGVDQESAELMSAALNRRRNQVVFALKESGSLYQSHRLSAEFNHELAGGERGSATGYTTAAQRIQSGHRFSRYDDPNAAVMGSLRDKGRSTSRLIAGTDDGFVVWMDRADTSLVMLGPTAGIWGDSAVTVGAGATTTALPLKSSPTLDTDLQTMRGAKLRISGSEAMILHVSGTTLHLDRALTSAPPDGTTATVGTRTRYWKSRWLDFGVPQSRKRGRYLDLVFTKQSSGILDVNVYQDFGATAIRLGAVDMSAGGAKTLPMDRIQARHVQIELTSTDPYEVVEVIIRVSDADRK